MFRLQPTRSPTQISPKTRILYLWTERGAARHAKMLETDKAWEVFEHLEDAYFEPYKRIVKRQSKQSWKKVRAEGKVERNHLTDAIQELTEYAKAQGSTGYKHFYKNYSQVSYDSLIENFLWGKSCKGLRDQLDKPELEKLITIERITALLIREEIANDTPYKEVYGIVKSKLAGYAEVFGKSKVDAICPAVEALALNG